MASSILRLKGLACSSLRCLSTGIFRSNSCTSKMSTMSGVVDLSSPSRISPWLMLPPSFEGDNMVHRFYNLAKEEVQGLKRSSGGGRGGEEEIEWPDDSNDVRLVGSSHGWVAFFNRGNKDLFLLNLLSGRRIKLPPIHTLPLVEFDLRHGNWLAFKVILSCSPIEEGCRAMMIFGPPSRLAFCCPGHCSEWTPIGALHFEDVKHLRYYTNKSLHFKDAGERVVGSSYKNKNWEHVVGSSYKTSTLQHVRSYRTLQVDMGGVKRLRSYKNVVYSSTEKLFYCITGGSGEDLEAWDLSDPRSPRIDWMANEDELVYDDDDDDGESRRSEEEAKLIEVCQPFKHLVFCEDSNELFVVIRYVNPRMDIDGSCALPIMYPGGFWDHSYPYKTIGFDVYRVDREEEEGRKTKLSYMKDSLDGLAVFIGINHSFAMVAGEFPELNPNSIYFTDQNSFIPPKWVNPNYGGHDNGIFNYETKKFSSCHLPCDYQSIDRIVPPPVWFTPIKY